MNVNNIPAVDHARAVQLAIAVLEDDDFMANEALTEAANDPRPESATNLFLAAAMQTVAALETTLGRKKSGIHLRKTLADLRGAEHGAGES